LFAPLKVLHGMCNRRAARLNSALPSPSYRGLCASIKTRNRRHLPLTAICFRDLIEQVASPSDSPTSTHPAHARPTRTGRSRTSAKDARPGNDPSQGLVHNASVLKYDLHARGASDLEVAHLIGE
jgi:hypothetical protein